MLKRLGQLTDIGQTIPNSTVDNIRKVTYTITIFGSTGVRNVTHRPDS